VRLGAIGLGAPRGAPCHGEAPSLLASGPTPGPSDAALEVRRRVGAGPEAEEAPLLAGPAGTPLPGPPLPPMAQSPSRLHRHFGDLRPLYYMVPYCS